MQLLLFSILLPSLAFASNATISLSFPLQRRDVCVILPIAPTVYNGLTPCGDGGLSAGCVCCPDNLSTCLSPIHECTLGPGGSYICCNAGSASFSGSTSDCAVQGLADCDNSCMPEGASCCSGLNAYCPSGEYCCQRSDGSNGCCPNDPTISSNSAPVSTTENSAPVSTTESSTPTSTADAGAQPSSSDFDSLSITGQRTTSEAVAVPTPGTGQSTSTAGPQSPFQTSIAARMWLYEPNGFAVVFISLIYFLRDA